MYPNSYDMLKCYEGFLIYTPLLFGVLESVKIFLLLAIIIMLYFQQRAVTRLEDKYNSLIK